MAGAEENTRRIVLLGKSGTGKSSLANTLFGEKDTFKVYGFADSGTKSCMSKTQTIKGRSIQLIDTPGFFDTDVGSEELKSEILKCIVECAPGPHAFLLVFQVGRFTPQEAAVVDLMEKQYFSEEALKYTTVVFTHGDQLDEGMKIEDWLKDNKNKSLKKLMEKCADRCCVIDNKYWNTDQEDPYRSNQYQIGQLLETIDQTVRKNDGYYTNQMLQEVQEEIKKEKEKLKQSSPNISEETLHSQAKNKVHSTLKTTLCVIGGTLLGGLLGAGAVVLAPVVATTAVVVGGVGAVGSVIGGTLGGVVGKLSSDKVDEDVNDAVKKQE